MKAKCFIMQMSSGAIEVHFKNGYYIVFTKEQAERFDLEAIEGFNLQKFLKFYGGK